MNWHLVGAIVDVVALAVFLLLIVACVWDTVAYERRLTRLTVERQQRQEDMRAGAPPDRAGKPAHGFRLYGVDCGLHAANFILEAERHGYKAILGYDYAYAFDYGSCDHVQIALHRQSDDLTMLIDPLLLEDLGFQPWDTINGWFAGHTAQADAVPA